jgi:hypothetical protein
MHEEQAVNLNLTALFWCLYGPRTPCYDMQELQKSVIINHIPQVTEGSTLYLGRIQLLSRHMLSSSCNDYCQIEDCRGSQHNNLHQMMFLAWHLLRRSMTSFSFFLFMFMVWHPSLELVGLAASIMFQLFSYFFRIDITLGVYRTISTHGFKMIHTSLI